MCTAIALSTSELPDALTGSLSDRRYKRGERAEYQFHWRQEPTILPVWREGSLELLPWGSKSRRGPLPYGGWIAEDHVSNLFDCPDLVVIPANLGFERGTWFLILEGIQGVVVRTRAGPVLYMLIKPSTNYYRNMTEQSPMMPVFINQVI